MTQQAKVIQIFGRRGTGKSNRARNLARQYDRILIVDRLGVDYSDGIIFHDIQELKLFWNTVCEGKFRLIYRPNCYDNEILQDELNILTDWVLKCGDMAYLIEELNVIYNYKKLSPKLLECVFAGRKKGVELITVAQRPKGFGQDIAASAEVFNVFATHHQDDLKYFKDIMEDSALEIIKTLEKYHYAEWDLDRPIESRMEVRIDEYIQPEVG